jgi:hypothetical protein
MANAFGWPSFKVLAGFGQSPNGGANPATATDITRQVNSVTISRGRDYELARASARPADLSLTNIDGRFDPASTAGPYGANVKLMTPLWVQAVSGATTYNLYGGAIERWPLTWTDPAKGVSNAQAYDALAALSQITLKACWAAEVLLDSPHAFYPLQEDPGSSSASDLTGNNAEAAVVYGKGATAAAAAFGVAVTGTAETMTAFKTTRTGASVGAVLELPVSASVAPSASGASWRFVLATTDNSPPNGGNSTIMQVTPHQVAGSFTNPFSIGTDGTGKLTSTVGTGPFGTTAAAFFDISSGGPFAMPQVGDGNLHDIVLTVAGDLKTVVLYCDGTLVGQIVLTGTVAGFGANQQISLGGFIAANGVDVLPYTASFLLASTYTTFLSAARVAALNASYVTAFSGETSDARIRRLLSYGAFSGVAASDIGSGQQMMGGATGLAGTKLNDACQSVADSELGVFYVAGTGAVTFRGRQDRLNKLAVSWVLGDAPGELPYEGSPTTSTDTTYLYNDVEVSRQGGTKATATSAASQTSYFPRTFSLTNLSNTDQDAIDEAGFLLSRYKDPHERVQVVEFNPGANSALWPFVLGAEIGDRVTFNRRPGAAPAKSIPGFVEAVEHRISASSWRFRVTISPLVADYGRLTTTRTTLSAQALNGATSISVNAFSDAAANPLQSIIRAGSIIALAGSNYIVTSAPATSTGYGAQAIGVALTITTGQSLAADLTATATTLTLSSTWAQATGSYTMCIDGEVMTVSLTHLSPTGTITARGTGLPAMRHLSGAVIWASSGAGVSGTQASGTTVYAEPVGGTTVTTQYDPYAAVDDGTGSVGTLRLSY